MLDFTVVTCPPRIEGTFSARRGFPVRGVRCTRTACIHTILYWRLRIGPPAEDPAGSVPFLPARALQSAGPRRFDWFPFEPPLVCSHRSSGGLFGDDPAC